MGGWAAERQTVTLAPRDEDCQFDRVHQDRVSAVEAHRWLARFVHVFVHLAATAPTVVSGAVGADPLIHRAAVGIFFGSREHDKAKGGCLLTVN